MNLGLTLPVQNNTYLHRLVAVDQREGTFTRPLYKDGPGES
jgi:hypothetical protein